MRMNLDITREESFIRVRVTGKFFLAEANDCVVSMFESIVQHGLQRVLVDCRQLEGELTTLERFVHATFAVQQMHRFADKGVLRSARFAYVGNEPLIDRHRFGQKVAVNRGLNVMVSLSESEALQWLENDRTSEAETTT